MQWLITGCSSGLGLELARAVLDAGQRVIASSRNPEKTPKLVAEIQHRGGQWITLDTTAADLEKIVADATTKHGPIDVLVNNAGYAIGGPIETQDLKTIEKLMAVNFYGPIRASQAVLPSMRERRSGVIVNISSAVFWLSHPGIGLYAASKFALEGVSESMHAEVAEFGIRVLIAEPGDMRTSFVHPTKVNEQTVPRMAEPYKGTIVDHVIKALAGMHGSQSLHPQKAAAAIVHEVLEPTLGKEGKVMMRMPLGNESVGLMKSRSKALGENAETFDKIALHCDF
jgi:short-subunit dehydrogenase